MKTASPLTLVFAPKLFPWKIGPPRIVKVARSKEGFVERVETRGAGTLGVPGATVALYLTFLTEVKVRALVSPVLGWTGLKVLKIAVAMVV